MQRYFSVRLSQDEFACPVGLITSADLRLMRSLLWCISFGLLASASCYHDTTECSFTHAKVFTNAHCSLLCTQLEIEKSQARGAAAQAERLGTQLNEMQGNMAEVWTGTSCWPFPLNRLIQSKNS